MGAPGFMKDTLSQMRLSQLRELARRMGVGRYSSMLRDQLIAAIQLRATRVPAPEVIAPEPPTPRLESFEVSSVQSPLSSLEVVEPPAPRVVLSPSLPLEALQTSPSSVAPEAVPLPTPPLEDIVNQASPTWVALLPRDPQWASVCWGISTADRERAHAAGGQQLALRLTDVTDTPDIDGRPHTLQEVLVDAGAQEWHLPVPLGDRDYRVELGYRMSSGGWLSLARSSVTRISAEEQFTMEPFTPFSLAGEEGGPDWLTPLPAPGLHERIYQQASAGRLRIRQGSEAFHETNKDLLAGAAGHQFSGVGPWASGREASGAGMAARQRSFWLVADAELIVYGATDPAASLTVGDQMTPLAEDGTFRFHTAFPDGVQNYPIRALAADGEQKRSITIDFRRSTPHAEVNPKEDAVPEWF